jgi:hypothetical protein
MRRGGRGGKHAPKDESESDDSIIEDFFEKLDKFPKVTEVFKERAKDLVFELNTARTTGVLVCRDDALRDFTTDVPPEEIYLRRATLCLLKASAIISDAELNLAKDHLLQRNSSPAPSVARAEQSLAQVYQETEDRKARERAFPWLAEARSYFAMLDNLLEQCKGDDEDAIDAAFVKDLVVKIQNRELSPEAIFMAQHLLSRPVRDAKNFALSLLLRVPSHEILRMHNWAMMRPLQKSNPGFFHTNGHAVKNLTVPLFPLTPECARFNAILLGEHHEGGGPIDHPTGLSERVRKLYPEERQQASLLGGDTAQPWNSKLPVYDNNNNAIGFASSLELERIIAAGLAQNNEGIAKAFDEIRKTSAHPEQLLKAIENGFNRVARFFGAKTKALDAANDVIRQARYNKRKGYRGGDSQQGNPSAPQQGNESAPLEDQFA